MGDLARINETLAERARDQLSGASDQLGCNHEEREGLKPRRTRRTRRSLIPKL